MESRTQQWAPYLGALGIALIVGAFLLRLVFNTPLQWLLLMGAVGIVLIALFLFTRPRAELKSAVTGRAAVYGSNTLILSIAFIGIVVLINVIVSKQFPWRLDLTANKQHTLAEQTISILKNIKDPIQVTGFFTVQSGQTEIDATNLIRDFQVYTDKLNYRTIDWQANPAAAQQYQIAQDTLVFEVGSRKQNIYTFDENSYANAILQATQPQQPTIYFTTGHGEIDPNDSNSSGLGSVTSYLQRTNYKVETLNLATITATQTISGGLPADTSAVVVASPTKSFAPADEQRLKTYLQNGGRMLIMVDPQEDPGLQDLLQSWGIALNNDLVLDPALNYHGVATYPEITQFPSHDVTKNLERFGVFFPFGVRSMHEISGTDKSLVALFTTTDQACGKTDFEALKGQQQIQCDPAKDEKGPFILGYAAESTPPGANAQTSRLIVIGNASFASNVVVQAQDSAGNIPLIENVINWLAGQEQLIAIPAKAPGNYPLNASSNLDVEFILFSNVALIPGAILLIGALIWWRRR